MLTRRELIERHSMARHCVRHAMTQLEAAAVLYRDTTGVEMSVLGDARNATAKAERCLTSWVDDLKENA